MIVTREMFKMRRLYEDAWNKDIIYEINLPRNIRITVLDRMTGFGYRDIETGLRNSKNKFWLASGNFDIRSFLPLNLTDVMKKIKKNSNNCKGI